jgi:hypothetical protein
MRWTGLLFWLVFSSGAIVIISKSAKEIGIERFGAQSLIRYFAAGNISVGFTPTPNTAGIHFQAPLCQ